MEEGVLDDWAHCRSGDLDRPRAFKRLSSAYGNPLFVVLQTTPTDSLSRNHHSHGFNAAFDSVDILCTGTI